MRAPERLAAALLVVSVCGRPSAAQEYTRREFWPEINTYINLGQRTRMIFVQSLEKDRDTQDREGNFTYYLEYALRPLFRRDLRRRDDVFRQRFLTFRAGYQYKASLSGDDTHSENRGVIETTARYPLPGKVVVIDRNRGEFRRIEGQGFSTRYRNRLWVERDLKAGRLVLTPYIYDEIFYDTRYGAWSRNRSALGLEIEVGPHVVIEPYVLRETNWRSAPRNVLATGLTLNLYF